MLNGRAIRRHWEPAAAVLFAFTLFAFPAGCGDSGPQRPETVPATGRVFFNEKPLEGAQVSFMGSGTQQAAVGKTDAEGRFRLTTFEPGDGAMPGEHRVTVSKVEAEGREVMQIQNPQDSNEIYSKFFQPGVDPAKRAKALSGRAKETLPQRYAGYDTSGLSVRVEKGQDNDFVFHLEP